MPSSSAARSRSSSSSRISARVPSSETTLTSSASDCISLSRTLNDSGIARLGDVLALDDRLVGLHAPDVSSDLIGQHLLQRVGGAVRLERPDLHLAEALAAELRLAAQRLLGDERVGAGRARVDLVVHEVQQLQDVHVADRHLLLERLAGAAVEERELARRLAARGTRGVDVHADAARCAPPAT